MCISVDCLYYIYVQVTEALTLWDVAPDEVRGYVLRGWSNLKEQLQMSVEHESNDDYGRQNKVFICSNLMFCCF
jgi:hypothetical protein